MICWNRFTICRKAVVANSRLNHDARLAEWDLLDLKRHQSRFLARHSCVLALTGNRLVQVESMLAIMIILLLAEQDACAIRQGHPTQKDRKQRMLLGNIRSFREQIPEHRSCQSNQIKGRIGLNLRVLRIVERFTVLLTFGFLIFVKLITHERAGFPHGRQTNLKCRPLKVDNLDQASLRRNTLQNAAQILPQELTGGGDLHDVIAMEVVVGECQGTLCPCQRKHDLCDKCRMMGGIFIFLQKILQCALTLLHDCGNHRNALNFSPRKGFISLFAHILLKTRRIRTTLA